MHVKAQLKSYEKLAFAVTIQAPVEDWRAVLRQCDGLKDRGILAWPMSGFVDCVTRMLNDLDKTHSDVISKEPAADVS